MMDNAIQLFSECYIVGVLREDLNHACLLVYIIIFIMFCNKNDIMHMFSNQFVNLIQYIYLLMTNSSFWRFQLQSGSGEGGGETRHILI